MGQSNSKVKIKKTQTTDYIKEKSSKSKRKRNKATATVSFGIVNPLRETTSTEFSLDPEWKAFKSEENSAFQFRHSAVLYVDKHPSSPTTTEQVKSDPEDQQPLISGEDMSSSTEQLLTYDMSEGVIESVELKSAEKAVENEVKSSENLIENDEVIIIESVGSAGVNVAAKMEVIDNDIDVASTSSTIIVEATVQNEIQEPLVPKVEANQSESHPHNFPEIENVVEVNFQPVFIDRSISAQEYTEPHTPKLRDPPIKNKQRKRLLRHSSSVPDFLELTYVSDNPSKAHSFDLTGDSTHSLPKSILRAPHSFFRNRQRNVTFCDICEDTPKAESLFDLRRGKTYGSVKLRKKKNKANFPIADREIGSWIMSSENLVPRAENQTPRVAPVPNNTRPMRNSVIQERDVFLELLSHVQDNRYENQRYTIKAGSVNDPEESTNEEVFEDTNMAALDDSIPVNGSLGTRATGSTSPELLTSQDSSPTTTLKSRHTLSMDGLDSAGRSLSPPLPATSSTATPGRRSMEALKRVIASSGPYPLLIESPDGGYWVQNGEYSEAEGTDGIWRAPEISTEHYTIQSDLTALAYGGHFCGQEHSNYIARDEEVGPVLLSLKLERDYQGTQIRAILRTQSDTMYKVFPYSILPPNADIPHYIRLISSNKLNVERAYKIEQSKAFELIRKFDEHPVAKTHKIGVVYQQHGQTGEEEMFGNSQHPSSLDEFLTMLGPKITLRGFEGYRGGLDVNNDQTGETSVHTTFKDREIMFHVSTLLPHDPSDTQHVQKKRHIGNDIVVVVFQEENTPFCPSAIRSHFIHSYIVVQVEHPNTDHTVYKVAVAAKDDVPQFGPPLPDPAVFQKGSDFRDWLLTKLLNAEYHCHMAPSFKKLATRTRGQLFLHLIEELTQSMDDIDYPSLTKGIKCLASGNDVRSTSAKNKRRRRRTLVGLFGTKKESQTSLPVSPPKRKSLTSESTTRIYQKLRSEPSSPRSMIVGSTPDLASASSQLKDHSGSDYILSGDHGYNGHDTPDLGELSRREGKGRILGRLTKNRDSEHSRKKPKRTKSFGGATGLSDYFRKRREATSPVVKRASIKRGSSEESSISSSLNWSVPYDLPSVVEADIRARRLQNQLRSEQMSPSRYQSNPTIIEHKESVVSVSDVVLSERTKMVDAAVQVTPYDWSNPFLTSFTAPSPKNGIKIVQGKKYRRSQSLQTTPKAKRKNKQDSYRHELGEADNGESVNERSKLEGILKSLQASQSQELRGSSEEREVHSTPIHRAESTDSIPADVGDLYDSVLQSLQSLTADVVKLRTENLELSRENLKFANQNSVLKERHHLMKRQLSFTQKQIKSLQLKLRLYQPSVAADSDDPELEISHV